MMDYKQVKNFIEGSAWLGSKLGLENSRNLLRHLGDPQVGLKIIHIAGTNGKGSAAAMLQSVLTASGYKTGRYTSPVITRLNEYMAIDGKYIDDEKFTEYGNLLKVGCDAMARTGEGTPTVFELMTAMAFLYFRGEGCDAVVLEVGMGGALDSTNVIDTPTLALLMPIGLDHMEQLGGTVEQIAREKAGIIKPGGTVVTARQSDEVYAVIRQVCSERGARLFEAQEVTAVCSDISGHTFDYKQEKNLRISLPGDYQLINAAAVCECIKVLREQGFRLYGAAKGLREAKWFGRFETLRDDPRVILDGAHNVHGAAALSRSLKKLLPGVKFTFVTGIMADKDAAGLISELLPLAERFITVTPNNPRAMSAPALAEKIRSMGAEAEAVESIQEGLRSALAYGGNICCFGSLYMAGEIRRFFGKDER